MAEMQKTVPVLYTKQEDCCGCGACFSICPETAITMTEDAQGFAYPVSEEEKCVGCGRCLRACPVVKVSGRNI